LKRSVQGALSDRISLRQLSALAKGRSVIPRVKQEQPTVIRDNPDWRRFKDSCPFYRERWAGDEEQSDGRVMLYQVICLQNTPPDTLDEQERCMESRRTCWRQKLPSRAQSV
jgi:hypothetical protein